MLRGLKIIAAVLAWLTTFAVVLQFLLPFSPSPIDPDPTTSAPTLSGNAQRQLVALLD